MGITLTEASKLVGITKNGLSKAIAKGKVSAEKDENGVWRIEPAELFRVYPKADTVSGSKENTVSDGTTNKVSALEREIDLQREQIHLLKEQLRQKDENHGQIIKVMEEHITTLKSLADQRAEQGAKKAGFWSRLFG